MSKVGAHASNVWRRNRKWMSWLLGPPLALGVVVTVAVVLWSWLSDMAGSDARARVTAVGTLVSVVFGFGGLVTLILLVHRQVLQTRAQTHAEQVAIDAKFDSTEKRAQELFLKAVEHLGNDKAAVRIGALHALDALGQEHADRRRAVMDVWCAYLRMPPPSASTASKNHKRKKEPRVEASAYEVASAAWPTEELQVRATAQRLITKHLRDPDGRRDLAVDTPAPGALWGAMDIDFNEASLHNIDLTDCHLGHASFVRTHFIGGARLSRARFMGNAWFAGAVFTGQADFDGAVFAAHAGFNNMTFGSYANFAETRFTARTRFDWTTFGRATWFRDTEFDAVDFRKATFAGDTVFSRATFFGQARFDDAAFAGCVSFDDTEFKEAAAISPGFRLFLVFEHQLPVAWRTWLPDEHPGRIIEWGPEAPLLG